MKHIHTVMLDDRDRERILAYKYFKILDNRVYVTGFEKTRFRRTKQIFELGPKCNWSILIEILYHA